MNHVMKLVVAALAVNVVCVSSAVVDAQSLMPFVSQWSNDNAILTIGGTGLVTIINNPPPAGAIYHQVVDVFYDGDGNKLETKSYTHAVGADCHPGLRQEDLVVQDDGRGNVKFQTTRLPSEPLTGVKPATPEGRTRAIMAIRAMPPAPVQLAETR